MRLWQLCLMSFLLLSGCASHSAKAIAKLDSEDLLFHTRDCREARANSEDFNFFKRVKMVVSPLVVVATGGLFAGPVLIANAGLETADHVNASNISVACGGVPKGVSEIAAEVALDAAVGVALGGVNAAGR
jgi:hypothetical protein